MTEVVIIMIDVVGRYFGAPLRGAQDITQMGLVLIVFGGMALCDRVGGHINVDLFEKKFPPTVIWLGDFISAWLGAIIFAAIAVYVLESAALSRMLNLATNIINLPKAWFQYFVVAACIITAFGMALRGIGLMLTGTSGKGAA
ncbi:TRAP transporter small permease [Pseudoprimorskyibacter insulae]|uniref:TRAP transporter small permease n=1 Tax=Pseudoprimorskyibacter insulae TaxID=1695997 RepID=UPI002795DD8C|nr:TRAP transporter small permease [Pseudoprimorskyibacter insulae]